MNDQDPGRKTILVIDDDESMRTFFAAVLTKEGFNVVVEGSSESAMTILEDYSWQKFDLLILDLMMPVISGQVIVKEMQKAGYQKMPILLVTGREWDQESIKRISAEPNVAGFWKKPIDIQKFRADVHRVLKTVPRKEPETAVKMLILNDNYIAANNISGILKMMDYDTTVAGDVEQGINYLGSNKPRLIIAEVYMLKKNDWALLKNMRSRDDIKNIPILFLVDQNENIHELMSNGSSIDDYITKPFEGKEILDSVRGLIQEKDGAV